MQHCFNEIDCKVTNKINRKICLFIGLTRKRSGVMKFKKKD